MHAISRSARPQFPVNARLIQSLSVTAGSLAIGLSAQGAAVKITLNATIVAGGANGLVTDLTGDSIADVAFSSIQNATANLVRFKIDPLVGPGSGPVRAFKSGAYFGATARFVTGGFGTQYMPVIPGGGTINYLNPISFTDTRISGGTILGYLAVSATSDSTTRSITLTRLIFDETTPGTRPVSGLVGEPEWVPVPEPSNGLLGLALGAAGVLRRRRESRAA